MLSDGHLEIKSFNFCAGLQRGRTALIGTAAEFGELFVGDTEKWGKVVRAANTKAD